MVATTVRLVGEKQLRRNLGALERQVLPRATANAINRTATSARKMSIGTFARIEKRKKKSYRSLLRVLKRARARVSEQAILGLFSRKQLAEGSLSKPFMAKGKLYRRRIPGSKWTRGRPHTSSPNLPIYPQIDEVFNRRARIVRDQSEYAMRKFYPEEVRAQIRKLVDKYLEKPIRRRGR